MSEAERRAEARVAELDRLSAVRPEADHSLQKLVDEVLEAFGAELCMVNLLTKDAQYFRAWSGDIPEELAEARWTRLDQSMCRYVVDAETPFVVEDFLVTKEFKDRPIRVRYGFRFYAGTPLFTSGGHAIGSLCLLSRQPTDFGEEDLTLLSAFARAAVGRLETLGALERERVARREKLRCTRRLRELGETLEERSANERKLREREERLLTLVRHGSDFITVLEADGAVRYTSPSIERVLGYRPEERVGRRALEDVHPEDTEWASRALAEALGRPGVTAPLEYRFRHADGSWRYLETIGNNLLDDPAVRGIVVSSRDVTERRRAEQRLRDSERKYRLMMEQASDGILVGDQRGCLIEVNPKACALLGYPREELLRLDLKDLIVAEDLTEVPLRPGELRPGETVTVEGLLRRADSTLLPVEMSARMLDDGGVHATVRDITERKRAEEELARLASFPELNPNPVIETGLMGELAYSNPTAEKLFPDLLARGAAHPVLADVASVAAGLEGDGEFVTREIEVDDAFYRQTILRVPGGAGLHLYMVDITGHKAQEEKLVRRALHDPLTDLPNRVLFMDRLEHALARTERREEKVAILYMDLDDFKAVNDSLGHEAGDRLLVSVGRCLRAYLRPEDTIARFGGDEFTILLENDNLYEATGVAERISQKMRAPFDIAGRNIFVTASIGVALGTVGDKPEDLLREADLAMYRAKARGKARHEVSGGSSDLS